MKGLILALIVFVVCSVHDDSIKNNNTPIIKYEFTNGAIIQKLEIEFLSKGTIKFSLISLNKSKKMQSKINGIAKSETEVDPEIDEDENGEGYPALEYIFEKGQCWLAIRVEMDSMNRVQIQEDNCENIRDKDCPFASFGILRRVKR